MMVVWGRREMRMPMSKGYRLQVGCPRPVKAHRVEREEALRLPWSLESVSFICDLCGPLNQKRHR